MTPLWARMLVFEAWKNKEITEECAHYFDKLILDNSKSRSVDGIEFEYSSMEDVLDNIGKIKTPGNFNLINYINAICYNNGNTDPSYPRNIYLSEITKTEKDYLYWILSDTLNQTISLTDLKKAKDYFFVITSCGLFKDYHLRTEINKRIEKLESKQKDKNITDNL